MGYRSGELEDLSAEDYLLLLHVASMSASDDMDANMLRVLFKNLARQQIPALWGSQIKEAAAAAAAAAVAPSPPP